MPFTRTALAGAALALLAPAAAADAATIAAAPCYIEQEPMAIQGTGWGPGSAWSVATDGQLVDSGTADATGAFTSTAARAPGFATDTLKPKTFTLTGQQDQLDVASTTFQVVDFLAKPKSLSGKPTKKIKWRFSGFLPGQPMYVHVRRKGKTYTDRIGVGSTPCGTLTTRLRRLPAWPKDHIPVGNYKIVVDNSKRYDKNSRQYRFGIKIFKRYF